VLLSVDKKYSLHPVSALKGGPASKGVFEAVM
jgi:hypothetical protein